MGDRERLIAYHEAGHAVMAVLVGREARGECDPVPVMSLLPLRDRV